MSASELIVTAFTSSREIVQQLQSLPTEDRALFWRRCEIVNLIGGTTTKSGLTVKALLDTTSYEPGQKVTDDEMRALRLKPHTFHGDWNYALEPRTTRHVNRC